MPQGTAASAPSPFPPLYRHYPPKDLLFGTPKTRWVIHSPSEAHVLSVPGPFTRIRCPLTCSGRVVRNLQQIKAPNHPRARQYVHRLYLPPLHPNSTLNTIPHTTTIPRRRNSSSMYTDHNIRRLTRVQVEPEPTHRTRHGDRGTLPVTISMVRVLIAVAAVSGMDGAPR